MESKKSEKSEEESLERKIPETSDGQSWNPATKRWEDADCIGLKETCPFQDQGVIEVHCRSDCAWYSDDRCIVWDLVAAIRQISANLSCIQTQTQR